MATNEEIEKIRQAIMRFRELLDIMQLKVNDGNRAYARLLAGFGEEGMKEKDVQWLVAQDLVEDPSTLRDAVIYAQFDAREMMRAFEELYNILIPESE